MSVHVALVVLFIALPLTVIGFIDLPPGGMQTVRANLNNKAFSWEEFVRSGRGGGGEENSAKSFARAKRDLESALEETSDPYKIQVTEEADFFRISFSSLIYKDRPQTNPNRYILYNKLPEQCAGLTDLPWTLFLPGYAAVPENYTVGFPFVSELINNGSLCCFYAFMPSFLILPTGGFWYTNNDNVIPETYIFLEVMSVISLAMGPKVTSDPERRILTGHSMGGYGAVMNAMRTNMQFFGSVCGLNGGLYIWNLPEFQNSVAQDVFDEAEVRKAGPFASCNYTQPPYRYYADDINFKTMVATSLAAVFNSDGTTTPKPNSPYFSPTLFNPDCTRYSQFFGFRFWLDVNGNLDQSLFNVAPWNSPLGFLQHNYPAIQKEFSGNLFLSSTFNDTLVDYTENLRFSQELDKYNVSHVLYLYNGTHYDVFDGLRMCLSTFAPKVCSAVPQPPSPNNNGLSELDITVPLWGWALALAVACVLAIAVIGLTISHCRKRRSDYESLDNNDFRFKS